MDESIMILFVSKPEVDKKKHYNYIREEDSYMITRVRVVHSQTFFTNAYSGTFQEVDCIQ